MISYHLGLEKSKSKYQTNNSLSGNRHKYCLSYTKSGWVSNLRNTCPLFFRHHVEFFALKWLILNFKPWITLPMYAYMRQELVSRLTSKVTQCTFFELRTTSLLYFFSSLFKGGFCWGYTVENLLMISYDIVKSSTEYFFLKGYLRNEKFISFFDFSPVCPSFCLSV